MSTACQAAEAGAGVVVGLVARGGNKGGPRFRWFSLARRWRWLISMNTPLFLAREATVALAATVVQVVAVALAPQAHPAAALRSVVIIVPDPVAPAGQAARVGLAAGAPAATVVRRSALP